MIIGYLRGPAAAAGTAPCSTREERAATWWLGLVQAPRHWLIDDFVRGTLVEMLADCATLTPLSVLYPSHHQLAPRARLRELDGQDARAVLRFEPVVVMNVRLRAGLPVHHTSWLGRLRPVQGGDR